MGSWSHLQVRVSQAHTQPPGQPGHRINLPFNSLLKPPLLQFSLSLGVPHGSTTQREWLRVCGADGASGQANQGLRLLSSPRTATGWVSEQKEESRNGPQGEKERSPETGQEANRALNTFSKSLLSLFSTLPLPHESRFPPVQGFWRVLFSGTTSFPKYCYYLQNCPYSAKRILSKFTFCESYQNVLNE